MEVIRKGKKRYTLEDVVAGDIIFLHNEYYIVAKDKRDDLCLVSFRNGKIVDFGPIEYDNDEEIEIDGERLLYYSYDYDINEEVEVFKDNRYKILIQDR